jgi:LysM repeat protein
LKEYFKSEADMLKINDLVYKMISKANEYSKDEEPKKQGGGGSSTKSAGANSATIVGSTGGTASVASTPAPAAAQTTIPAAPKTETPKTETKTEPKKTETKTEPKKTETPKKVEEKKEPKTKDYIVKSGDNLTKIAREHGVTLDDIKKANPDYFKNASYAGHMRDSGGNKIWPGDVVKIPSK